MPTRIRTAVPRPVVARNRPEVAGFRLAATGIEDRAAGLVGEQLRRGLEDVDEPIVQRRQIMSREADPVCERRPIDRDALTCEDLGLTVERQVIGILRDEHVGDERFDR